MDPLIAYRYLIDPDEVREALAAFADQPIIGLDTETFWDYSTRQNRLSLLQLAAPTGEVVVIDALAAGMEETRSLIENPAALMAAHNANFDYEVLRQAGFAVEGLIDTLRLARRTLRLRSFSLASVSEHLLGLTLDKSLQKSDWRPRPLSREQLNYAALDAQVALRVYQELTSRLEQEGRLAFELRRARIAPPTGQTSDSVDAPSRRRSPALPRPLTAEERQLVEKLRLWRTEVAEREQIPPYLICHDRTFEHLVMARPSTIEELAQIFGLGPVKIAKYGAELLSQLTRD